MQLVIGVGIDNDVSKTRLTKQKLTFNNGGRSSSSLMQCWSAWEEALGLEAPGNPPLGPRPARSAELKELKPNNGRPNKQMLRRIVH
ncbi:GH24260 [Drosophila grimshawi]|uniref:GH24260 n=1 Tax=Drosophila grimshawi TaxID=7222 RepID=B4JMV6_DROGR|nr:GH24260 [Drosophila grimshawi]